MKRYNNEDIINEMHLIGATAYIIEFTRRKDGRFYETVADIRAVLMFNGDKCTITKYPIHKFALDNIIIYDEAVKAFSEELSTIKATSEITVEFPNGSSTENVGDLEQDDATGRILNEIKFNADGYMAISITQEDFASIADLFHDGTYMFFFE